MGFFSPDYFRVPKVNDFFLTLSNPISFILIFRLLVLLHRLVQEKLKVSRKQKNTYFLFLPT